MKNPATASLALVLPLLVATAPSAHAARTPHSAASSYTARPNSSSSSGNLGLGVMLGEPTGFTMKYWLSQTNAFDAGLSYSFGSFLLVMGDYLWHFPSAFSNAGASGRQFVPYLGGGLALFFDTSSSSTRSTDESLFRTSTSGSFGLGFRIPLGIEFLPPKLPLGVFAELAPGLGIVPSTFGFFQGDVGVRFYL